MDLDHFCAKEIIDHMMPDQINKFLMHCVNVNYDCMSKLLSEWRRQHTSATEKDAIAQCLLQMMLCNTKSILLLFEGLKIVPGNNYTLVDPISMVSILRSIYERTYIFHNIFVEADSENEKRILFIIWQIRGLNNRQTIEDIPSIYIDKKEKEKQDIESLRQEAETTLTELPITSYAKKKVQSIINSNSSSIKGYRFQKSPKGEIIDFQTINLTDSPYELFNDQGFVNIYKLLSWHTHPSFLGVLQFGQMFNEEEDKSLAKTILTSLLFLQNKFINDFLLVVDGAKTIYDTISEQEKIFLSTVDNVIMQKGK